MATVYPTLKDAAERVTKYLPAAGASIQSPTIDLESTGIQIQPRWIEVTVPAMAAHTDSTKIITLTLQDSADNSSFADVEPLIQCKVPGVASTGSLATTFRVPIPPDASRYLQFTQTNPSGGPAVTTTLITYDPIFANV